MKPLSIAGFAALALIAFTSRTPRADAVDREIGNGGFNRVYPIVPGNGIDGDLQITRRLTALEELLRRRDMEAWPERLRAERARNLDRLHRYRLRGIYPRNYDHPEQTLPCFIDNEGTICAVGYLIEQSAGRAFAELINDRYRYATVAQMSDPAIAHWIARSGLTRAEVETIQEPGFSSYGGIKIETDTARGRPGDSPKAATTTASTTRKGAVDRSPRQSGPRRISPASAKSPSPRGKR